MALDPVTSSREDWLTARRAGIGGSDAAAVLGLSKWRTPLDVYLDKRGEQPPSAPSEAMHWGTRLEPLIREEYAERTGRLVRVPDVILQHPAHPWMLGNIDGVTDDGRLVEIKTTRSAEGWGDPGTDQVPEVYLCQVQHYLAVTALPVADVAVLVGGSDFRVYEVPADQDLQELLIESEARFWERVVAGVPPEPISLADARRLFTRAGGMPITASQALEQTVADLLRYRQAIARLEGEAEEAQLVLCTALGQAGADTLVDLAGRPLVTWKVSKPTARFDAKAFQAARPDLYAQFLRAGEPTRRFLVKGETR